MALAQKKLDEWLDGVDYKVLNSPDYLPSDFALTFMNFIKLVNGSAGESHATPPVHLKMLDKLIQPGSYIANLCYRAHEAWNALARLDLMLREEEEQTSD